MLYCRADDTISKCFHYSSLTRIFKPHWVPSLTRSCTYCAKNVCRLFLGREANIHIRNKDGQTPVEVVLLFVFDKLTFIQGCNRSGKTQGKSENNLAPVIFISNESTTLFIAESGVFALSNRMKFPSQVGYIGDSISKFYRMSNLNNIFVICQVALPDSRGKSLLESKLHLESCQESIRPRILHRYNEMSAFAVK